MGRQQSSSPFEADLKSAYEERREQLRTIAAKAGFEEVADVVQESFLKAVEADTRAPIEKPLHFLRRITRNAVIDRLRTRRRAEAVFSPAEAPDTADLGASPERALIASERLGRAMEIIKRMPERRRAVFMLHRLEELTLAQCGKRLGISVKTVEKHMAEAMAQLSREIEIE